MSLTPSKINIFLMFRLPAAYFTGVRLKSIDNQRCVTTVKHRWISQNPFNSLFWAVQGMAAELSTGAMVMSKIKQTEKSISMLVASNQAVFHKKARGRIFFTCIDGERIDMAINNAIKVAEGQTVWLTSIGVDASGDAVSEFKFEWTLKMRSQNKK